MFCLKKEFELVHLAMPTLRSVVVASTLLALRCARFVPGGPRAGRARRAGARQADARRMSAPARPRPGVFGVGDARAPGTGSAVWARSRGPDFAGLGLPALRPRFAGAAGNRRAACDFERAAGEARQASAADRHRGRRDPADADTLPGAPVDEA